jgi:hypothetical protein
MGDNIPNDSEKQSNQKRPKIQFHDFHSATGKIIYPDNSSRPSRDNFTTPPPALSERESVRAGLEPAPA